MINGMVLHRQKQTNSQSGRSCPACICEKLTRRLGHACRKNNRCEVIFVSSDCRNGPAIYCGAVGVSGRVRGCRASIFGRGSVGWSVPVGVAATMRCSRSRASVAPRSAPPRSSPTTAPPASPRRDGFPPRRNRGSRPPRSGCAGGTMPTGSVSAPPRMRSPDSC